MAGQRDLDGAQRELKTALALDPSAFHQTGELNVRRAGYHHHPVAQGFTIGFIKKGNICKEELWGFAVLFRFSAP